MCLISLFSSINLLLVSCNRFHKVWYNSFVIVYTLVYLDSYSHVASPIGATSVPSQEHSQVVGNPCASKPYRHTFRVSGAHVPPSMVSRLTKVVSSLVASNRPSTPMDEPNVGYIMVN